MNVKTQPSRAIRSRRAFLLTVVCVVLLVSCGAYAQKGVGDRIGVVRQGLNPPLTKLSGKIASVETHPCENTTGYALAGTHLIVEADDGTKYNLHVGPADAVAPIVKPLTPGTHIEVRAFRTPRMSEDQYMVTSLRLEGGKVIDLRDANLRPFWFGQGQLGPGRNPGAGLNQRWTGWDRGWTGRGQAWIGGGQGWAGRGQGWAGRGQGWAGRGQGWAGRGQGWGCRRPCRWQAAPRWSDQPIRRGWRGYGPRR